MKKFKKNLLSLTTMLELKPLESSQEGLLRGGFLDVSLFAIESSSGSNNCQCNGNNCQCSSSSGSNNCQCNGNNCQCSGNNCLCGGSTTTTTATCTCPCCN